MDTDTYSNADVIQLSNEAYLNVRLDGDKEKQLCEKFGIEGFPSTFIVDGEGQIIARLVGYLDASGYLERLKKTREASAALRALLEKSAKSPDDLTVVRELSDAYRNLENPEKAKAGYQKVIDTVSARKDASDADKKNKAQAFCGLLELAMATTVLENAEAVKSLNELIARVKSEDPENQYDSLDDALAAEVQMLMSRKEFDAAIRKARESFERFPKADKSDMFLYVIAMAQYQSNLKAECRKTLKELNEKFPATTLGKYALTAIEYLDNEEKGK